MDVLHGGLAPLWLLLIPSLPFPVPSPPDPPKSVSVKPTHGRGVVAVSWVPPAQGSRVTGYQVFVNGQVKASATASQTKVSMLGPVGGGQDGGEGGEKDD